MTDVCKTVMTSFKASRRFRLPVLFMMLVVIASNASAAGDKDGYYGKHLGKLKQLHHGVSGDVYAVDARTLHIRDFNYDGEGPAAYFYVGNSKAPSGSGTRINDEKGSSAVLPRYRGKHITLTLPEGKTMTNIKWFSVWCDEFSVNFGDVKIPKGFVFPKPQKLEILKGIHGVSSENVVIVDAQTLLIPSFSYDGEAPDAKFWVGSGAKPSPQGIRIPDENGKMEHPLRRYDQKTIVLTLPGDMTVFDIGHFGVWCEAFAVDFGNVKIPKTINVPPSLKMLGVSPQKKARSLQLSSEPSRFQQLVPFSATQHHQEQQHQQQQQQQQQQYNNYETDETRVDPVPQYQNPNVQTFYRVTTYKPNYQLRAIHRSDDNQAYQLIPSISVNPAQTYYGQTQTNNAYEIVQPYQTQQQSNVYDNKNNNNNYDQYRLQRPQQPEIYQQNYALDAVKEQPGKSFSRVSINGAGGQSNTFIQYKK